MESYLSAGGKSAFQKIIKKFASIKMAVVIIALLSILTAIGTFVEAKYDATAARKLVFESLWMFAILGLLSASLIAVMVDRWPWKKHHSAFVCAHIGILALLLGSLITWMYGLDGSVRVGIGETNRFVTVPQTDIIVYTSFDGNQFTKIFEREVDFFREPPRDNPFVVPGDQVKIKIVDYKPYVLSQNKVIEETNPRWGSAVRFQVSNARVNVIEWLAQRSPTSLVTHDFGPAKIHLGSAPLVGLGQNEIYLFPFKDKKNQWKIKYSLFGKKSIDPEKEGIIEEGGSFPTGWMGLEVKVLRFYPMAREEWDVKVRETPTPLTTEAVQVDFSGKKQWLLLNDTMKVFSENAVYYVSYANRRVDMGFPIQLREFIVDRYEGTMRAAAYKSHVIVPEVGEVEISMNEPLYNKGLTVYQSSFQDGPDGRPIASVFSVNYDPGRWLKYLGSLVMVIGIILLFYFRKRMSAKKLTS
ncbi:MAG: cytochrome c biogenesis protein ResB [Bdellovibrionota bacterium]